MTKIEGKNYNILVNKISKFKSQNQKSQIFQLPIKLPKSLIQSIEFIVFITNRTQNELLTEFIIDELDTYLYDHNSVILSIVERNGILDLIKQGKNQYFGGPIQDIQEKDIVSKVEPLNWTRVNLELLLNKKIINFVEKYCKLSKISKTEFITLLITARLDCIRTCPEIILDYVNNSNMFFEELKEGLKEYSDNISEKKKIKMEEC